MYPERNTIACCIGASLYIGSLRHKAVLNDSSKGLLCYLELLLRKMWEELVLLNHVPQYAHKQILQREDGMVWKEDVQNVRREA